MDIVWFFYMFSKGQINGRIISNDSYIISFYEETKHFLISFREVGFNLVSKNEVWVSSYNIVVISKFFNEKIEENLNDILHDLTKTFFLLSLFKVY